GPKRGGGYSGRDGLVDDGRHFWSPTRVFVNSDPQKDLKEKSLAPCSQEGDPYQEPKTEEKCQSP
ncbi:hypothetical protein KI387_042062, partial [Taxus chinensis]